MRVYDLDLVEEEAIIHYHSDCDDIIKEILMPFIKWLQEAEEESEEESDKDEQ